jgi:hypothetical protein
LRVIFRAERPAAQQRDAEGLEIRPFDHALLRRREWRVLRALGTLSAPAVEGARDRQSRDRGGGSNAGNLPQPRLEVAVKTRTTFSLRVASGRQIHGERHHP